MQTGTETLARNKPPWGFVVSGQRGHTNPFICTSLGPRSSGLAVLGGIAAGKQGHRSKRALGCSAETPQLELPILPFPPEFNNPSLRLHFCKKQFRSGIRNRGNFLPWMLPGTQISAENLQSGAQVAPINKSPRPRGVLPSCPGDVHPARGLGPERGARRCPLLAAQQELRVQVAPTTAAPFFNLKNNAVRSTG